MKRDKTTIELIISSANSRQGFTLLELLIAMSIFLIIIASALGLYLNHQKHAYVQEEVTDLQQSLRLATESILEDIRMAGMAVSLSSIESADNNAGLNGSDIIQLNSVSSEKSLSMIDIGDYVDFIAGTSTVFTVNTAYEASNFKPGDIVRVLNPTRREDIVGGYLTVHSVNTAVPTITLIPSVSAVGKFVPSGSLIAKTAETAPDIFPNIVEYCIGPATGCGADITSCPNSDCLIRMVNGTATEVDVTATNITGLQLAYLIDGSSVEVDTLGALQTVRAVRVTLSGENTRTKDYMPINKRRELTTIVKLRNR